ncbi:hypothetical protein DO70_3916 [Burkholderia pseudomallei]|nr:hypothetical protein DO70_3916 [Burkholderia pseudomallei]
MPTMAAVTGIAASACFAAAARASADGLTSHAASVIAPSDSSANATSLRRVTKGMDMRVDVPMNAAGIAARCRCR